MLKEFKMIVGKRVLGVSDGKIYLEDGISIDYHPFETYLESYTQNQISKKKVKFYVPELFEK